jgi:hypothetical protein
MEILARRESIAALVGDTFEARIQRAFDSEDSFFYAVGYGHADLYTFNTLDEAGRFAKRETESLTSIERSIDTKPADATESLKIAPIAGPIPGRRRKRA